MTETGWRECVVEAVRRFDRGDPEMLDLCGRLLSEQDNAKQRLRELGFGVTGTPWPRVTDEVAKRHLR